MNNKRLVTSIENMGEDLWELRKELTQTAIKALDTTLPNGVIRRDTDYWDKSKLLAVNSEIKHTNICALKNYPCLKGLILESFYNIITTFNTDLDLNNFAEVSTPVLELSLTPTTFYYGWKLSLLRK